MTAVRRQYLYSVAGGIPPGYARHELHRGPETLFPFALESSETSVRTLTTLGTLPVLRVVATRVTRVFFQASELLHRASAFEADRQTRASSTAGAFIESCSRLSVHQRDWSNNPKRASFGVADSPRSPPAYRH